MKDKDSKLIENRKKLIAISQPAKVLVKIGKFDTVNEAITSIYAEQGHKNLKTFRQWLKEGRPVKKGEKALLLWGEPVKRRGKKADQEAEEAKDSFFPICYVFSENQVSEKEAEDGN